MLETVFDEALLASQARDTHKVQQLMHQMAGTPDEAVAVLLKVLQEPGKGRQALAISVLQVIGSPHNAPAIPALIYYPGDWACLTFPEQEELEIISSVARRQPDSSS